MSEESLSVRVEHRVGDFSLSADVQAGTGVNVLFGPSGAGKSTLLNLVAGLARPRAGTITLHGRTLADAASGVHVRPQDRRIGMVFQQPLLLPHRSALSNVALAVREGHRHDRRAAAHRWLRRVGVDELAARRPRELSGGQQQRVALARALAGRPQLVLLDEPFSSLDDDVRRRLGRLVRDLVHDEGLTAVFVTHDRDEVAALADRVLLAGHGTVTAVVDPHVALDLPAHGEDGGSA